MAKVKTRYGVLNVPNVKADLIGRFLQHYGEWAWDEAYFVASILPENARVLDVGAFVGTFGLGLAANRQLNSICFVEANAKVIPFLEDNVQRNATVPCVVREAVVLGDAGQIVLGHADPDNLGSTSFVATAAGQLEVDAPANSSTLAQLREENGPFDLIKLDTEGLELDILKGDADFLSKRDVTIWVECNETTASLETADLLLSWGMDVYFFAFPSHNPDNLRGAKKAIFPVAYEAALLAAPKIKPVLDETLRSHACILEPVWSGEDLRKLLWRTPRWGLQEWENEPLPQALALAGRALRGDDFANFLEADWAPGEFLWERAERVQNALDNERRVFQEMLESEQRQFEKTLATERQQFQEKLASQRQQFEAKSATERQQSEETLANERQRLEGELATERQQFEERLNVLEAELRDDPAKMRLEAALAEATVLSLDRLSEIGKLQEERSALQAERSAAEERIARLQDQGSASEEFLKRTHAEEIARLQDERSALEERLNRTHADQIAQLREERSASEERHAEEVTQLSVDLDRLRGADVELGAITRSATWRLARRAHRMIDSLPLLHRLLRFGRRTGGKLVRFARRAMGR